MKGLSRKKDNLNPDFRQSVIECDETTVRLKFDFL